jgi:hypothetical protein
MGRTWTYSTELDLELGEGHLAVGRGAQVEHVSAVLAQDGVQLAAEGAIVLTCTSSERRRGEGYAIMGVRW